MAREPEPKLKAEDFAAKHETEDESGGRKISNTAATVLITWAIILDLLDLTSLGEYLVTDVACVLTIDLYLLWKGASPVRMFAGQGFEVIPGLDVLPAYTAGTIWSVVQDRSTAAALIGSVIPKGQAKRLAGTGEQAASKVRSFSQRAIAAAEKGARQVRKFQDRIPGPLRSVPGSAREQEQDAVPSPTPSYTNLVPSRGASQGRTAGGGGLSVSSASSTEPGDLPFPDTYVRYERELLPELEDVVDVDVTGAGQAPPPPGSASRQG